MFRVILWFLVMFVSGVSIFSCPVFSDETDTGILTKKTLKRWVDPVVLEGCQAEEMIGPRLSHLRLYAFKQGVFEPIRYQIDEMSQTVTGSFPKALSLMGS